MLDASLLVAAAGPIGLIVTAFLLTFRQFYRMEDRRRVRVTLRTRAHDAMLQGRTDDATRRR